MHTVSPKHNRLEPLHALFRKFEAEALPLLLDRERSTFDRLAHPWEKSLILFGAGPLGKTALAGLRKMDVEPIAFADNNPKLWGTEMNGLKVMSPEQAARDFGHRACFVVTIFEGSKVQQQLAELGCQRVHFAPLFWKYSDVFIPANGIDLPHSIREQAPEIESCFSMLSDELSRTEFLEQLEFRYSLDSECLSPPLNEQNIYFPDDLVSGAVDDVFVDCGAFNGDSVRSFLSHRNNKFRHILAFEPDPVNREALSKFVTEEPGLSGRVTVLPYALANENTRLKFNVTSSAGSSLAGAGGSFEVECRRLDDLKWDHIPSYIKMDIEGAEVDALIGSTKIIQQNMPVLAICLYHRSQHLWQIPNLIHSLSPEYSIFIRRYAEENWETVCYAVPAHRLGKSDN